MLADSHFSTQGATIAYQFTGSGPPFGYAHGVFLSRAAVRRMNLFDVERLGRGRSLLTYDQRGHGHSTGRGVDEDYRFEKVGQDLLGLIDHVGLDQPMDFAGSSLGAAAALYAALAAPHRFRRLVLVIPPVAWESGPEPARRWYVETAERIETLGAAAWREQWTNTPPLPIFADYPTFDLRPDMPDELIPHVLRGIGTSDLPAPDAVATLPHPTLILTWDTDPLHPVSTAERLHELLPGSTLHVARSVDAVRTWTDRTSEFLASETPVKTG